MKIYLARHGQTNYNDLGLCNSDPATDVYLTETGVRQATALAKRLSKASFDHVFVSELKRTQQTAEIINKDHRSLVNVDRRLNDNRTGYEDKHFLEYYAALDKAEDRWTVRFNDGESIEDVKLRVESFIDDLRTHEYKSVLVVTSMVIVQAICGVLNGLTNQQAWDLEVDKASCMELDLES